MCHLSYDVSSGLVMEYILALNRLGWRNSFTFGWVLGHDGNKGTEGQIVFI